MHEMMTELFFQVTICNIVKLQLLYNDYHATRLDLHNSLTPNNQLSHCHFGITARRKISDKNGNRRVNGYSNMPILQHLQQ